MAHELLMLLDNMRKNADSTTDLAAYPYVGRLIALGYADSIDDLLSNGKWVMVCDEGGRLILFDKHGMARNQILDKLETYAKELLEDGMVNDEINGVRERLWSD